MGRSKAERLHASLLADNIGQVHAIPKMSKCKSHMLFEIVNSQISIKIARFLNMVSSKVAKNIEKKDVKFYFF